MDILDVIACIIGWAVLCILLYFCLLGITTFIITSKPFDMIRKKLRVSEKKQQFGG